MASREPAQRIITAKETTQGRRQRKELCVEIGSFKHPYFSNSVRRQIQETGKECFSPKLSAKILEKQYERRASVRLNYAFNGDEAMDNEFNSGSGILTSQQIRSSMMHGTAAASTSSTPLTIDKTNAQNDKNKNKNKNNTNTNKHNTNEDLSIVTSNLHAHSNATKMSPGSNKASDSTEDSEETIDWNARARNYNPIFVKQKRKVASALLEMSKNHSVRNAVVRDGGVKALGALVRMFDNAIDADCSDALCCLADAEATRNAMFSDGAVKAILHLAGRTTSIATKYSLSLALGSLACEHGYEMDLIDSNSLHSLLDMRASANTKDNDDAVGRALYNFATSSADHGRYSELASALLALVSAPGGRASHMDAPEPSNNSSSSDGATDSNSSPPVLESSAVCRTLFYRSIACMARIRPLHSMLVNGGTIGMLQALVDRMTFDTTMDYEVEGMNPVEASTIAIIILCLLSSTASIRVLMVEEGAIKIVMNIANEAMARMEENTIEGADGADAAANENDADIVCLAVAMLTNLALNAQTRSHVVSAGAVPVIIGLSQGGNESIARACASALRGLTSDDNTDNLIRIMHDGGIQAVLYLSSSTRDVVTRRNCALAIRNIFSHTDTLEELLNNPELASVLTNMYVVFRPPFSFSCSFLFFSRRLVWIDCPLTNNACCFPNTGTKQCMNYCPPHEMSM
jgi:hypothetical protein